MNKTRLRAAPALAGVIASVVVLGAGPALGVPIWRCREISNPGFYQLARNLTADVDCLVVAADFVTLDLGGFVITGTGEGSGITDKDAPRQEITVRNGTVTGFDIGVNLFRTSDAAVEKVRALDNDEGILTGPSSIISGNTSGGGAIGIGAGSGSTISGNIANGSDIGLQAGPESIITGNHTSATDFALSAGGCSIVSGNTATAVEEGIGVGPGSLVSDNTVASEIRGIVAGPGSTIRGNTARAEDIGGDTGILANCPSNVIGNTATGFENNLVLSGAGCTNIDNLAP